MESRHALLQRQLKKHFGADFSPPPEWEGFLKLVSNAYQEFEADRVLVESSLELSSQELFAANAELRAVFQALPDLVMRLDRQGNVLASSGATSATVLEQIHSRVGEPIQKTLSPVVSAQFSAALAEVVLEHQVLSLEYSHVSPAGEVFCEARLVPHLEDQVVVIIRDITSRKEAERQLEKAHRDLLEVSRRAGMAEVATGVIHNVGNVLNSVNITSHCVLESLRSSKLSTLTKLVALIHEHSEDLAVFMTEDPKGRRLPQFLDQLNARLQEEHLSMDKELCGLRKHIDHIIDIVTMQQNFARVSEILEFVNAGELVEDALKMNVGIHGTQDVEMEKDFAAIPPIVVEKHKVLQILVNLIRNATQSCLAADVTSKRVHLRVCEQAGRVTFTVRDNGLGISPENLNRIFIHGFTTKQDGHGFGLHSGAIAAKQMGGSLSVSSDGVGKGACFELSLPIRREAPGLLPPRFAA